MRVRATAVLAVLLALGWPRPALAQAPADRVAAMVDAFSAIADWADAGAWQQADAAFNGALDTMDLHRAALEAEQGEPAARAFAAVDGLLRDLDASMTAEDVVRTRATIGYIQSELVRLVPGRPAPSSPREATELVLRWRQALDAIQTFQSAGQWRDMRNAAMDLATAVQRGRPTVQAALGPDGGPELDEARVFAMRLTAAALDASASDGDGAARRFRLATDRLLERLGVLPTATPTVVADVRLRFRSLEARAAPGDSVVLPLIAEDLPQVGLGSYRVRARWSPAALRLADVAWDVGAGDLQRDDAAGLAELALPPAPTGPTGTAILARLRFEVLGGTVEPRAYLPAGEVTALDEAVALAGEKLRLGDVPAAARALSRATIAYLDGAGKPGSLYASLDGQGLAAGLATRLVAALDLLSQPAPNDILAAVVGDLPAQIDALLAEYIARQSSDGALPVTFEVLQVTDTAGRELAHRGAEPGLVRLPATPTPLSAALATLAAAGGPSPTTPPDLVALANTPQPSATPLPGTGARAPRVPPAALLFVALALAAVLGAAVVYWSQRAGDDAQGSGPEAGTLAHGRHGDDEGS